MTKEKNVGLVQTEYFTFAQTPHELALESKEKLGPITVAYETYGSLNAEKSNAVLILHALSGDAHAAGLHKGEERLGWWDDFIGPGKAFDTDKYFVICSNVLGGCQGTTGPGSTNPKTNKPYALDFPLISIGDMVRVQKELIDYLGIDKLLAVCGGSMGGMQALAWLVNYPEKVRSAIPIACSLKHSPQQIAFNEVGRQAIMADSHWKEGNYYGSSLPSKGLALARMIGHITYMSDTSMAEKFGRQRKSDAQPFKFTPLEKATGKAGGDYLGEDGGLKPPSSSTVRGRGSPTGFTADFEVEGYLRYRGDSFVKRFDANSYLYITKAMDNFDATGGKLLSEIFKVISADVLAIAFKSDWLYPAYQSKEIVKACKLCGVHVTYCEIDSSYGHDAFLLEAKEETHLISHFLKKVASI
ncbi:MAG: homoserine O-acetyltransferase [Candidatus Omnitrophica bacterium]|nr:homoserine O-acetyltransferase [Candidatus Omnitrophota bacterium]